MIGDLESVPFGDLVLVILDGVIDKFLNPPAAGTHDVIVVGAIVQLKHGPPTFEVVMITIPALSNWVSTR